MQTCTSKEKLKQYLTRQEVVDTSIRSVISYSGPQDVCGGFPAGKLGNQAGGFPFKILGHTWPSSEHLYLLGYWSGPEDKNVAIQKDVLSAKSGYAAKRFKKNKHKKEARPDFYEWRHEWMLWVVWQKCLYNEDFRKLLLSTDNARIVEVVKKDPVWAAWYDEDRKLVGANGMGKILMICRHGLLTGRKPSIDEDLLNSVGIWILGERVQFPGNGYMSLEEGRILTLVNVLKIYDEN